MPSDNLRPSYLSWNKQRKDAMKIATVIARVLMGLVFIVFGLNGFFHFIPQPKTPMPDAAQKFMAGLMATGYMFPLLFGLQTLVGVMLVAGLFVPLAIVLIAPVIVNIILFHVFVMPATIAPGIVVLVLECYLVWAYRSYFRG